MIVPLLGALLCGGARLTDGDLAHGYFMQPTVLGNVAPTARIACEEVFGPVVGIIPVDSFDEALTVANSVDVGLSASLSGSETPHNPVRPHDHSPPRPDPDNLAALVDRDRLAPIEALRKTARALAQEIAKSAPLAVDAIQRGNIKSTRLMLLGTMFFGCIFSMSTPKECGTSSFIRRNNFSRIISAMANF